MPETFDLTHDPFKQTGWVMAAGKNRLDSCFSFGRPPAVQPPTGSPAAARPTADGGGGHSVR